MCTDLEFIAQMQRGIPPIPPPTGLEVIDTSDILKGNADLEPQEDGNA